MTIMFEFRCENVFLSLVCGFVVERPVFMKNAWINGHSNVTGRAFAGTRVAQILVNRFKCAVLELFCCYRRLLTQ